MRLRMRVGLAHDARGGTRTKMSAVFELSLCVCFSSLRYAMWRQGQQCGVRPVCVFFFPCLLAGQEGYNTHVNRKQLPSVRKEVACARTVLRERRQCCVTVTSPMARPRQHVVAMAPYHQTQWLAQPPHAITHSCCRPSVKAHRFRQHRSTNACPANETINRDHQRKCSRPQHTSGGNRQVTSRAQRVCRDRPET